MEHSILVLGDETTAKNFTRIAIPQLETRFTSHHVTVLRDITEKPCDTVILAFDLEHMRHGALDLTGENILVRHYGESIYRHIIVVLISDEIDTGPDDVADYIEQYASLEFKELLKKCECGWELLHFDNDTIIENEIKCLKQRIDNVMAENCGPFKHRFILLGGRDSKKYRIGNMLLKDAFDGAEPSECNTAEGVVYGKRILVVNTPAVRSEKAETPFSANQMKISESLLLTSPGPRVYVMVFDEGESRTDMSACVNVFERRFGKEAYSHLIVVFTCQKSNRNTPDVLLKIKKKVDDDRFINGTAFLQEKIMDLAKIKNVETAKKEISFVLIGPSRIGKSHTANNILNIPDDDSVFDTRKRQRNPVRRVSVAIRAFGDKEVLVADTPSYPFDEAGFQEIEKCIFLPNKALRPIVLILRCDQAPGDNEVRIIEDIRNKMPEGHTGKLIFLFTRKDVLDYIKKKEGEENEKGRYFQTFVNEMRKGPLRVILSACQWRCVAFKNKYENGQLDNTSRLDQNEVLMELAKRVMNPNPVLRLVLVGHTGSGKSASGNTIISTATGHNDDRFNETFRQTSNTEECQVEEIDIAGRKIHLVDTPGLFDNRCENNNTLKELSACLWYTLPGPHAFLVVINVTKRATPDVLESLRILKEAFGDEMLRHTIVIFTRVDAIQGTDSIERIIWEIEQASEIGREFVRKTAAYVTFNNCPEGRTGNEAADLLENVEIMLAVNGHRCFTNQTYEDLVHKIKWYGTGLGLTFRYHVGRNPNRTMAAVGLIAGMAGVLTGVGALPAAGAVATLAYAASQSESHQGSSNGQNVIAPEERPSRYCSCTIV